MSHDAGNQPIILASSSPRRRELLALSGLAFEVRPADADETPFVDERPEAYAQRMSGTKAGLVVATTQVSAAGDEPATVVIGADTIVVLDVEARGGDEPAAFSLLGKPRDAAEATEMLRQLRGRRHRVITAISVAGTATTAEQHDFVTASVPMRAYGEDEIAAYVATGNPLDKAGAYAIQFAGFQPVDRPRFTDCFATVMGLPVCTLLRQLAQTGIEAPMAGPLGDCHHFEPGACPIYPRIDKGS
jgi:MAF protein